MTRLLPVFAAIGILATPATAVADQKSDCMKGIAMIKVELKKKHPQPVLERLRKALDSAQTEVAENDWPECLDFVTSARNAVRGQM
jgi:hypothetical protein